MTNKAKLKCMRLITEIINAEETLHISKKTINYNIHELGQMGMTDEEISKWVDLIEV